MTTWIKVTIGVLAGLAILGGLLWLARKPQIVTSTGGADAEQSLAETRSAGGPSGEGGGV